MEWQELIFGGVPLGALVVGLIALLKKLGLPIEYAPWVNGGLAAVGFSVVMYIVPSYPEIVPYLEAATGAIVVFLTASGIYQFGKVNK